MFIFIYVALCDENNILTRANVAKFQFQSPRCLSDMAKAYENGTGENCALNTTDILVKFPQSSQVHISEVGIQRDHPVYPGNVRQISAYFNDANGSPIVNQVTNETITYTSLENEPIIRGDFQNVSGVVIKVLNLDNNTTNPTIQRLRLKVNGCYSAGLKIRF
jgi:hypothetical protein